MEKEKKIVMPRLSPNMEEAVLVGWSKELNEPVKKGDVLFEVETDKVICEIESDSDGVLDKMCFEEGDQIKAGDIIAVLKE